MTRVVISSAIIMMLVSFSIFSGIMVNKKCEILIEAAHSTAQSLREDDREKTAEGAKKIGEEWENFRRTASMLIHNDRLAEVDRICARIEKIAEGDSDGLDAELAEFEIMVNLLRDGESPKISKIF